MPRTRSVRSVTLVAALAMLITLLPAGAATASGGTPVMSRPVLNEDQLVSWWNANVPSTICNQWVDGQCEERKPYEFRAAEGEISPRWLIRVYLEEGAREGVAGDIAFMQAVLETAWFYYPDSGQVRPSHNNFAGMGAFDSSPSGEWVFKFSTVRQGVRAQLQHLRIYADPAVNTTGTNLGSSLVQDVEGRYPDRWRTVRNARRSDGSHAYWAQAQRWEDFGGGMWATDPYYAPKILDRYRQALVHNGYEPDAAEQRVWHYRFANRGGAADALGYLGREGDEVLACDWNGNGRSTPGIFRDGVWRLANNTRGVGPHIDIRYGRAGDLPICGDFNGDGRDTIGIVRDRDWHVKYQLTGGAADRTFRYGRVTEGDLPLVGDWNGNGRDTIGIVRGGQWHLRNSLSGGPGEIVFTYGRILQGDRALVGDWNGNGRDGIGIVRGGEWHLRNSLSGGPGQLRFVYGRVASGDVPVTGDWNRDGRDTPAIVR